MKLLMLSTFASHAPLLAKTFFCRMFMSLLIHHDSRIGSFMTKHLSMADSDLPHISLHSNAMPITIRQVRLDYLHQTAVCLTKAFRRDER